MYEIKKTDEEINDLLNACSDQTDKGGSKFPGMSYEEGLQAAIEWLTSVSDEHPLD